MIGICGRGKRHRDRGVGDHPFQEEGRPSLGPKLLGEVRQRTTLDELVQPRLLKRHVDRNCRATVCRGGDDTPLSPPTPPPIMPPDNTKIPPLPPLFPGPPN